MKKHTYTVTHQQFLRFVVVVTFALAAIILVTCLLYTIVILQRNQTYVDIMLDQYETSVDTQMEEYTQLVQTAAYDASVRNYLQAEEPYARYLAGQEVSTLFHGLCRSGRAAIRADGAPVAVRQAGSFGNLCLYAFLWPGAGGFCDFGRLPGV